MHVKKVNPANIYNLKAELADSRLKFEPTSAAINYSHLPVWEQITNVELSELSPFQRILMTADGTLTKILEAYLSETIWVVKLSEGFVFISKDMPLLNITVGKKVIERKILLQGKQSKKNWLYAKSIIIPDRLDKKFKERLIKSKEPIGKLWMEHRIETFKEIISSYQEPAEDISDYFKIGKDEQMLCRTYRVFSDRKPIMMITEKFPETYFK